MGKLVVLADSEAWVRPLIASLRTMGVETLVGHLQEMSWQADAGFDDWALVVNRVASRPEPVAGHPTSLLRTAQDLLVAVELAGIPCIHGSRTYAVGCSKALQAACIGQLGLRSPQTWLLLDGQWPGGGADGGGADSDGGWLLKPNAGGFGRGIARADAADGSAAFSLDGTAVLQRRVQPGEPYVYRAEFVGRKLAYVAASPLDPDHTDYCLARPDAVARLSRDLPAAIHDACVRILDLVGMQLGSVEYLIDEEGEPVFIDINPVSSPHPSLGAELGIDLWQMHADLIAGVWAGLDH